jgi:hypothetical protein
MAPTPHAPCDRRPPRRALRPSGTNIRAGISYTVSGHALPVRPLVPTRQARRGPLAASPPRVGSVAASQAVSHREPSRWHGEPSRWHREPSRISANPPGSAMPGIGPRWLSVPISVALGVQAFASSIPAQRSGRPTPGRIHRRRCDVRTACTVTNRHITRRPPNREPQNPVETPCTMELPGRPPTAPGRSGTKICGKTPCTRGLPPAHRPPGLHGPKIRADTPCTVTSVRRWHA